MNANPHLIFYLLYKQSQNIFQLRVCEIRTEKHLQQDLVWDLNIEKPVRRPIYRLERKKVILFPTDTLSAKLIYKRYIFSLCEALLVMFKNIK